MRGTKAPPNQLITVELIHDPVPSNAGRIHPLFSRAGTRHMHLILHAHAVQCNAHGLSVIATVLRRRVTENVTVLTPYYRKKL